MTVTSVVSGPVLDEVVKRVTEWYATTRLKLIEALEDPQAYGQRKLTQLEQLQRFANLQPQDWDSLIANLYDRYRGLPDTESRVNQDLANYIARMVRLQSYAEVPNE